ncbi:MAG: hypothetical protein ACK46Q_16080 [Hyphomonas sp.]
MHRLAPWNRPAYLSKLIVAARDGNSPLRNILTDPSLLGAARGSTAGKLFNDIRDSEAQNIAKEAHTYCRDRWGIGIKDALAKGSRVQIEEEPEERPARPHEEPLPAYVKADMDSFRRWLREDIAPLWKPVTDNPPPAL